MNSAIKGEVEQANDRKYVVDLELSTCDCGHFQENVIPCEHAYSCLHELRKSTGDYVPEWFSIATWTNTYLSNLHPVSLNNLRQYPNVTPRPFLYPPPGSAVMVADEPAVLALAAPEPEHLEQPADLPIETAETICNP